MTCWQKPNTQLAILYILYRTPLLRQGEVASKGEEKDGHSKDNRIAIINIRHTAHTTTVCNSVFIFSWQRMQITCLRMNTWLRLSPAHWPKLIGRLVRLLLLHIYIYLYIYRLFSGVYIYIYICILRVCILPNDLGVQSVEPAIFF